MLSEGRLQFMKSYVVRNAANPAFHTGEATMAVKFLQECFAEITRLRGELSEIATGKVTVLPGEILQAYHLREMAQHALAEPELGEPDFVCRG